MQESYNVNNKEEEELHLDSASQLPEVTKLKIIFIIQLVYAVLSLIALIIERWLEGLFITAVSCVIQLAVVALGLYGVNTLNRQALIAFGVLSMVMIFLGSSATLWMIYSVVVTQTSANGQMAPLVPFGAIVGIGMGGAFLVIEVLSDNNCKNNIEIHFNLKSV